MLPIIRTFISLPAGVAKMPFWRFSVLTLAGCIPWVFMLTFIGKQAGDNWEKWKDSLHYVDYAVAAIIVGGVAYLVDPPLAPSAAGRGRRERLNHPGALARFALARTQDRTYVGTDRPDELPARDPIRGRSTVTPARRAGPLHRRAP